ncbi:MAG: glycosyltransferase family 2 protein [Methanobrevibacter sp.]|jgi:hypothetical protein|nr:glycosyltransferase family 2 protein [Candidatus Methanovirga meridionalis]
MNNKNLVVFSIIIPVFNTKIDYFLRCLESIKENDLDKNQFEVIIINDGMENFESYTTIINNVLKANNIQYTIIHNDINMKQGYSRYRGLKVAKGDYIHFVDSDDEIFPYTYTNLINYLKHEPNFIIFKEESLLAEVETSQQDYVMNNLINGVNQNDLENHLFYKKDVEKIRGSMNLLLHSKIFNRLWLLENTNQYVPNLYVEDTLLTIEILLKTEKFKVCLDKLYHYHVENEKTTMVIIDNKLFFDALFVFDKILNMIYLENRWGLRYLILDNILGFYDHFDTFFMKDKFDLFYIEMLRKYKNINYNFINKKHCTWFNKRKKLKKIFSPYIFNEE